jgi:hypothetical protein
VLSVDSSVARLNGSSEEFFSRPSFLSGAWFYSGTDIWNGGLYVGGGPSEVHGGLTVDSLTVTDNLGLNGAIFAALKAFKIDHPLDPENKYLLHYCIESPEVMNAYSGKVVLDGRGEALVELPPYFASINKDPRYTLTAIGAAMPLLHVAEEVREDALEQGAKAEPGQPVPACSFRIAGGAPGAKVSWRVEALRNDRWVQTHGAPVEVEKKGNERGTYQHPDLYNQPPERGTHYAPAHQRPDVVNQSSRAPAGGPASATVGGGK